MPPLPLRAAALACAAVLSGTAQHADAQQEAEAEGTETPAPAEPAQPASPAQPQAQPQAQDSEQEPAPERTMVLFLMPQLEAQTQVELREALLAQFALIDADIAFEDLGSGPGLLGERMADAQRRAAEYHAIAVFWVEPQPDGRWFVHMMDIERERIVVRPADAAGDRRISAIEAVAVMVRESTRALIAGVPIPELAPAPPAAPPPAAPAPLPPPVATRPPLQAPIRFSAGYLGTDFAEELPWRHGAFVGIGWFVLAPVYIGASYVFTPALEVDSDDPDVDFDLRRMPIGAHAGYRQRWDRALLDVELGVVVEILQRSALHTSSTPGVEPARAGTQAFTALAPRLRGELTPLPQLGVFVALGLDILLNNFSYVTKQTTSAGTQMPPLLRADDVRPVVELGVAFYP